MVLLDAVEQLENRHPKSVGNHLDGVERRVGLTVLDTAQIRLVKTALFAKDNLAHARGEAELSYAQTESFSQGRFHTPNYVVYAINHINTNSYKRGEM